MTWWQIRFAWNFGPDLRLVGLQKLGDFHEAKFLGTKNWNIAVDLMLFPLLQLP